MLLGIGVPAEMIANQPSGTFGSIIGLDLVAIASFLGPMAWGGLGATVFLLKTISDRVSDFRYECKRLSGTGARIFLGMVFGVVVVKLFGTQFEALSQIAISFLAGLGTKAVYAAIEALVNGIAGQLSGRVGDSGPRAEVTSSGVVVSTGT